MEDFNIVRVVKSRHAKQKKFLEDLNNAVDYYVWDILERGNNDELLGDEYYQYIKCKVTGIMIIPIDAKVVIKDRLFRVGEMLETFLHGRYDMCRKLDDINKNDIQKWMGIKKLQYDFDKKDRATKDLVIALKCYVNQLKFLGENGAGTDKQVLQYNKMKVGEPIEIVNEASVDIGGSGEFKLFHRLSTAGNNGSSFYNNEIVKYVLQKYNMVYKTEDKDKLRQKEVEDAIAKYKNDIICRYELGTIKKKEIAIYNKIIANESFELPYRLIVNIGTEKYPIEIALGRVVELMEQKILTGKRNALVTDDMSFVNKVIDMGIKMDDKVLEKVNEINGYNLQLVSNN